MLHTPVDKEIRDAATILLNADCSGSMLVVFVEHEPDEDHPGTYRGIGCDEEGVYLEATDGEIRRLDSVKKQDFELAVSFNPDNTFIQEMSYASSKFGKAYALPYLTNMTNEAGPSL
ncbi:hypothetical protein [Bosea sp. RAC05]|uniref:hypothetical protein n=1 Tax=Bosea sp. RAC05 TaxID=1842539 RepID=UPI0008568BB0|nr:hypothetical protein [Bosea sp. RAC05]AOG03209.1 hypothetical protein BSY19_5024 [Bosea sp. RAC05]